MYSFQKPRSLESVAETFQFFAELSSRSRKRFFWYFQNRSPTSPFQTIC
jgi:hypothetical protein